MKDPVRFWSGLIILLVGILLTFVGFFVFFTLIYGILGIVIGILLLLNIGKEEQIEKIKRQRK